MGNKKTDKDSGDEREFESFVDLFEDLVLGGETDKKLLDLLMIADNACNFFHMWVDAILSLPQFKETSFDSIEIRVSTLLYLQLLKYWGKDYKDLLATDPIYNRIYLDTNLEVPIKVIRLVPEDSEEEDG